MAPANLLRAALYGRGGRATAARVLVGLVVAVVVLVVVLSAFVH